jgi:RNA-binding protein
MANINPLPSITPQELRDLKSRLHHLKPVVIIGANGLSDEVVLEIDRALTAHELIKIRSNIENREERSAIADTICSKTKSALIQIIGQIIAIYRPTPAVEE